MKGKNISLDILIMTGMFALVLLFSGMMLVPSVLMFSGLSLYISIGLNALLSGWFVHYLNRKMDFSTRRSIENNIVSTSGPVIIMTLIMSILNSIFHVIITNNASMGAPILLYSFPLPDVILSVVLYIVCFNIWTVFSVVKEKKQKELLYYAIGLVVWTAIFVIARYIQSMVLATSF